MITLASPEVRAECCARLERLDPNAVPKWGRMTAHQMVCHLSDSFKVAAGEKTVSPAPGPIPKKLIKWIAVRTPFPWPHNFPTRPEIEQGCGGTAPADWDQDRGILRELILSFHCSRQFGTHPMFGPITWEEWQIWAYRHVDHHFRQFGV